MQIGDRESGRPLRLRSVRVTDADEGLSRTLVCLVEPVQLRNISYSMLERRGSVDALSIDVFLPYGHQLLRTLPAGLRREGALGSDFSYDDLRLWLYEQGHTYNVLDERPGGLHVRGNCDDEELARIVRTGSNPFVVVIDPECQVIRRIDYLDQTESLTRTLEVIHTTLVRGVVIPTLMTMTNWTRGHSTSIELVRSEINLSVDEGVFEPARRLDAADYLSAL